jgi:thiamine transport system substrate-binding protein
MRLEDVTMTPTRRAVVALAGLLTLAGCGSGSPATMSTSSSPSASSGTSVSGSPSSSSTLSTSSAPVSLAGTTLTVVAHDSFTVSDSLMTQFEKSTGMTVKVVAPGDAGTVVNQLILSKDSPLGDVVFGIDNTFAGRAESAGILTPYAAPGLPASAAALAADDSGQLTPIDYGDVCVNADRTWFSQKGIGIPTTLADLTRPEYRDLLVVENPASSSPGLAFLAATVGASGDPGFVDYWTKLRDNGVEVAKGWTEAYSTEFSGSSGKGPRPLVVSYSTSPAYEVPKGADESRTVALLDTCFRQVEYAGVIKGAANEAGARAFIDFLLSKPVQEDIPGGMYMYPVLDTATLPADWVTFAPLSSSPIQVKAADIAAKRDQWIKDWTAAVIG